jgi:hypothetical protein
VVGSIATESPTDVKALLGLLKEQDSASKSEVRAGSVKQFGLR